MENILSTYKIINPNMRRKQKDRRDIQATVRDMPMVNATEGLLAIAAFEQMEKVRRDPTKFGPVKTQIVGKIMKEFKGNLDTLRELALQAADKRVQTQDPHDPVPDEPAAHESVDEPSHVA